jgi:ribosome maturation factor RimP
VGELREGLLRLLEPAIAAAGFELVELECDAHGGRLVRLYIERPAGAGAAAAGGAGQGGVTVEDCATVSRRVGALLDAHDPIRAAYTLEVSSPGFDRPLRTRAHFERFRGSRVRVETLAPHDGRRRWTGRLRDVGAEAIALEVDGRPVELRLDELKAARLVPESGAGGSSET